MTGLREDAGKKDTEKLKDQQMRSTEKPTGGTIRRFQHRKQCKISLLNLVLKRDEKMDGNEGHPQE